LIENVSHLPVNEGLLLASRVSLNTTKVKAKDIHSELVYMMPSNMNTGD